MEKKRNIVPYVAVAGIAVLLYPQRNSRKWYTPVLFTFGATVAANLITHELITKRIKQ